MKINAELLKGLQPAEKAKCLLRFGHNLTIGGRGIWSDENSSIKDSAEGLKELNELQHRVLSRALSCINGSDKWDENDFIETVKFYESNPLLSSASIGQAFENAFSL